MALLVRDNRVIIPWLRDAAPPASGSTGAMTAITMAGPGVYFTNPEDVGTFSELIGFLNVTAADGASTMDIVLQGSADGKVFDDLKAGSDKFVQVTTAVVHELYKFEANFGKYIRFKITLAGAAASYTFSLKLVAKG